MKKLLTLSFCVLISITATAQNGTYTIRGTLPDNSFNGNKVMLVEFGYQYEYGRSIIDSTFVQNGVFSFIRTIEGGPAMAGLWVDNTLLRNLSLILEPGQIKVEVDSLLDYKVSGTLLNDEYFTNVISLRIKMKKSEDTELIKRREEGRENKTWTQEDENDYQRRYIDRELLSAWADAQRAFFNKYMNLPKLTSYMAYSYASIDTVFRKTYLAQLPEPFKSNLAASIERVEKMLEESRKNQNPENQLPERIPAKVAVGQSYTDVVGKTTDGKEVKLSELVQGKKLTVLDFWASWCGPCLREMPFMLSLHEEFKDKGVAIVGISTDAKEANWKRALSNNNMPWAQMLSQEAGQLYYVNNIPYTIIIDSKGVIVARRLRGEQLKQKIVELLGEN